MLLGHESLKGLDRDRLLAAVEPVLAAHVVDVVELAWRSDPGGWLLSVTVERPGTTDPGAGVTLDLCSELSRDLSAALDVADVMPVRYRLEVGSPGVERALYGVRDYARFAGRQAKLKVRQPAPGQRVLRGTLGGMDAEGRVVITGEHGESHVAPAEIESARLTFDWQAARGVKGAPAGGRGTRRAAARDR